MSDNSTHSIRDTISLTMIVKNEQENLAACLESVQDQVDEIIIVDTGSTDLTMEIAKRYTSQVYEFSWQEDFSAARNFAIEKAHCTWILSLDADEILVCAENYNCLKDLIRQHNKSEAFLLPLENPTFNDSLQANRFHVLRLFTNKPEYRFSGSIHEQVMIENNGVIQLVKSPVIRHAVPHPSTRNRKRFRNLQLLTQALKKDPENAFLHYYLGIEWMMLSKPDRALPYLQTAYNNLTDEYLFVKAPALKSLIICLKCINQVDEALILCLEAAALYPDFTDIYYLAGTLFTEKGEFSLALKWFKEALEGGEPPEVYSHFMGTESYLSHYYLGYCQDMLGNIDTAREHYETSLQLNPKYLYPFHSLFLNLRLSRGILYTYAYFNTKDFLNHLEFSQILAREFFNLGYPGLAKTLMTKHIFELETLPDSELKYEFLVTLADYHFFTGEMKKAQAYLKQIPPSSKFYLQALIRTSFSLLVSENYPEARNFLQNLWSIKELRPQIFLLLKLNRLMETGEAGLLPLTIREKELSCFLMDWFKELHRFQPDHPAQLERIPYTRLSQSLQVLLLTLSPQSALALINYLEEKETATKSLIENRFGLSRDSL